MSDIILGALLGVGGGIVGAVIGSVSSYIITRSQISAHHYELNRQEKYNVLQARIDRVIKARETVLIPLRQAVSKWLESEKRSLTMTIRVGEVNKRRLEYPGLLAEEIQLLKEAWRKSEQASSELETLRGQIHDSKLSQMIEEAIDSYREKTPEIIEIELRFHDRQNWNPEAVESITKDRQLVLKGLRDKLLVVNKRIEQLLSGEESA